MNPYFTPNGTPGYPAPWASTAPQFTGQNGIPCRNEPMYLPGHSPDERIATAIEKLVDAIVVYLKANV